MELEVNMSPPHDEWAPVVSGTKEGVPQCSGVHETGEQLLSHVLMQSSALCSDVPLHVSRGMCRHWRDRAAVVSVIALPSKALAGPGHCCGVVTACSVMCASPYSMN